MDSRTLVVALALGVPWAGCTGPPANAAEPDSVILVTAPTDYSYLANDSDSRAHRHDYWAGRTRVTIFEGSFVIRSCTIPPGGTCSQSFRPAEDQVIYPGTRWVNATVRWSTDETPNGKFTFGYQAADGL